MFQLRKIAAYGIIGTITFCGSNIAEAAEIPVAGIDLLLGEYYEKDNSSNINLDEFFSSNGSQENKGISFANVTNYANIRSKADEESELLGRLFDNSAATILEKTGDWYKIKSGEVTGYIKSDYLITGKEADKLAKTMGTRIASVDAEILKVREKASLDSPVITLVPNKKELIVKKETDGWVKVSMDGTDTGFVSSDYVTLRTEYEEAVSIKQEMERLAAEAAALEAEKNFEDDASRKARKRFQAAAEADYARRSVNGILKEPADSRQVTKPDTPQTKTYSNTSKKRSEIVEYALRFLGNPYVWGGTSLTKGADCSGYTQSVFRDNGILIPRTSRTQAIGGRSISIDNMKPGDLIFYGKNGIIDHVSIYIGNGKAVAASSPETGIRITKYDYRQPYKVVNYID